MPAWLIPALLGGLGAIGGGLGNRKQQTKTDSTQSGSFDTSSSPLYDPTTLGVRDNILARLLSRNEAVPDFTKEYELGGLENINTGNESLMRNVDRILTQRGLNRSPVGANASLQGMINKLNQGVQFRNTLPLLQRDIETNELDRLTNFFSGLPVGQRTSGTSTGTSSGTQEQPGNVLGGLFGGGSSLLGLLYGLGAFGGGQQNKGLGGIGT